MFMESAFECIKWTKEVGGKSPVSIRSQHFENDGLSTQSTPAHQSESSAVIQPRIWRTVDATPERQIRNSLGEISKFKKIRNLRRLDGFVVERISREIRVCFIDGHERHLYDFPLDELKSRGIETPNQPFQMDEIEYTLHDGTTRVDYEYRPLSDKDSFSVDSIRLNRRNHQILTELTRAQRLPST